MTAAKLPAGSPAPYTSDGTNVIYNLLFCDQPALFASDAPDSDLAFLTAPNADAQAVRRLADDAAAESRKRVLAFNWLRSHGAQVPARILLGAIVEVPLERGLDTLAVFADGRIRYINQSGKMAIFETPLPNMSVAIAALLAASQNAINHIGPWTKPRLPPPPAGSVRLTFLVSDGLYFGQGPFNALSGDNIGGPVLKHAGELLVLVTDAAT
jgi:hypothetical protein